MIPPSILVNSASTRSSRAMAWLISGMLAGSGGKVGVHWDRPKPLVSAPWQLDSFRRIRRLSFPSFENFGAEISAPNCQVGKRAFGTVPRIFLKNRKDSVNP
jgi:hypothetical protein